MAPPRITGSLVVTQTTTIASLPAWYECDVDFGMSSLVLLSPFRRKDTVYVKALPAVGRLAVRAFVHSLFFMRFPCVLAST